MDEQLAARQLGCHRRMGAQVVELRHHVLFGQHGQGLLVVAAVAVLCHHAARYLGMTQPGFHRGHGFQRGRVEHRFHRAAVGVAANDDVLHAQGHHRVFDGGGDAAHHLPVGRHHVTDVAVDEQVAGRALGDQLRHHARVGAGDEHGAWVLGGGELLEQLFLLREDLVAKALEAIDDAVQRLLGGFVALVGLKRNHLMFVRHALNLWVV